MVSASLCRNARIYRGIATNSCHLALVGAQFLSAHRRTNLGSSDDAVDVLEGRQQPPD